VLEKHEEYQLNRSCEQSIAVTEERNIQHTTKRKKVNWIGHILRRNCLLKHVTEGKIQGRREVTGKRGRRGKHLQGDLKEVRILEALECSLWRTHLGRGFRSVVIRTEFETTFSKSLDMRRTLWDTHNRPT
jgi:hypothetical protein